MQINILKDERNVEIKKVKKLDNEVTAEFYIESSSESYRNRY